MEINQEQLFNRFTEKTSKHEFEFQSICSDLEPEFGKLIWTMVHKPGVTNQKLKEAGRICREKGILTIPFLYGVLKRLP